MNDNFLKYFIIHLKNVVFFKFTLYLIIIIISVWLIQISSNELAKSVYMNVQAEESIVKANIQLNSIVNSDKEILGSTDKYKKILETTMYGECFKRKNIENNLHNLINKYNLSESANTIVTQSFLKNKLERTRGDHINIRNYDVKLNFSASNFTKSLEIIKEAYYLMPENTLIVSLELEDQKVLDYNIINTLSITKTPDLINTKLVLRVREIHYNK